MVRNLRIDWLVFGALTLILLFGTGCSTNPLRFSEKPVFDNDGAFVGMHTTVKAGPKAGLGGKLEEGAGTLLYEGIDADGNHFTLNFGNTTKGMDSGDAVESIVATVAPLVESWMAATATAPASTPGLSEF